MVRLFRLTLFASAFLVFTLELMLARMLLPRLGGAAAVWNACTVFYQVGLLLGYAVAALGPARLGVRRHGVLHLFALVAACAFLPPAVRGAPAPDGDPATWLVGRLALDVGLPFVLLGATAPLLQQWFVASRDPREATEDPYPLYAASNLGSFAALCAYPAVIEPSWGLGAQAQAWSLGFAGLVALVALCALAALRPGGVQRSEARSPAVLDTPRGPRPTWGTRGRWLLLAAVPSSLTLGATAHLTTDLAPVPLLWVVPLGLYLLSFVLAFAARPLLPHRWLLRLQPFLLVPLAVEAAVVLEGRMLLLLPAHLAFVFVSAMVCHRELHAARPHAAHLGEFYLLLALGGALGGAFNGLLAPVVFEAYLEYPIAMALACLARPLGAGEAPGMGRKDLLGPALLTATLAALLVAVAEARSLPSLVSGALVGVAATAAYAWVARPVRFGLALAGVLACAIGLGTRTGHVYTARSFYGVHRLSRSGDLLRLQHGDTWHGAQDVRPAHRREPLTYYHRGAPVGDALAFLGQVHRRSRVAVVGLGVGTLAAYGGSGERWTFIEIDPSIVRTARDLGHFTYLRDSAASVDVMLGDGRKRLLAMPDGAFDVILLDAFSSDAVPAHLLTAEALATYVRKLAARGVLLVHTSNRYMALTDVLAAAATHLSLVGWIGETSPSEEEHRAGKSASEWVLLARRAGDFRPAPDPEIWEPLPPGDPRHLWTDERTSLLPVLDL